MQQSRFHGRLHESHLTSKILYLIVILFLSYQLEKEGYLQIRRQHCLPRRTCEDQILNQTKPIQANNTQCTQYATVYNYQLIQKLFRLLVALKGVREFRETRAIAPARLNYFRRAVGRTRKTIASHS